MGIAINLSEKLVKEALLQSKVFNRSIIKQIEHWAKIGHVAENNPTLTYPQIVEILLRIEDHKNANVD